MMIDASRTGKPAWSCLWWTVHLVWGDGTVYTDRILGETLAHAEERASTRWPGVAVTVLDPEA